MAQLIFRVEDAAGNRTSIPFTASIPVPGDPTWLTTFQDIHDAIYDNEPTVFIGDGVYDIPHNSGLYLANAGQRIIGQSAHGTILRATGTRGEMKPQAGGLSHDSTKGVFQVAADSVEIGNLTLTTALTGGRTQASVSSTTDPNTYIPAGIWAEGNNWYFHDLIIDKCSFGMQLWIGSNANTLKRVHRCVITNWGYRGTLHGNSGYAIYEQCLTGVVEHKDIVCQTGTDFGYHNYGSFTLPAQVNLTGIVVIDSGSPIPTGSSGADTALYMAKSERLRVENVHTGLYHPGSSPALANTLFTNNKVGYDSGYNPKKFEAVNTWHFHNPNLGAHPANAWQKNSNSTWTEGFTQTGIKKHWLVADRPSFSGLKPLGGSWFINYGTTIPEGYHIVPGTKTFLSPTHGQPPMMIVRPNA